MDSETLKGNTMYRFMSDIDAFVGHVKRNVCGHELMEKYSWLQSLKLVVTGNCSIIPGNLKKLRYTGYVFSLYNTVLMHVLLSGTLPVSGIKCVPILT
jgi:hypothetical protein